MLSTVILAPNAEAMVARVVTTPSARGSGSKSEGCGVKAVARVLTMGTRPQWTELTLRACRSQAGQSTLLT